MQVLQKENENLNSAKVERVKSSSFHSYPSPVISSEVLTGHNLFFFFFFPYIFAHMCIDRLILSKPKTKLIVFCKRSPFQMCIILICPPHDYWNTFSEEDI